MLSPDGWELTLFGLYSMRQGHWSMEHGLVDGDTEGWGLGLDLASFLHVSYDEATYPRGMFGDSELVSWTVVVDAQKLGEHLAR